MKHNGYTKIGIGNAQGENAIKDALNNALQSDLFGKESLHDAKGILFHWTFHKNLSLNAATEILEHMKLTNDSNVDIVFGATTDENLAIDAVKITIIATGYSNFK